MDRHLSPAETAKRFGISIKALRLYEQRGLLTPIRTNSGATGSAWRAYGPDQIAQLHQILALKRLGLSLARIAELLAGPDRLEAVLALQEHSLARNGERLSRALALVRSAQAKLRAGQSLSIDDLTNLTKETVMTQPNAKELNKILRPFSDRHISRSEREALKAKVGDRDQIARDWNSMMAEWQTLMQASDPASPAAQDLARRWIAFSDQFRGTDIDLKSKEKAILKDAMNDPATVEKLTMYREISAFAGLAVAHMKAQTK